MTYRVTRTRKYTVNLGNYEMSEVGATIEMEVGDQTYERTADTLDGILDTLLDNDLRRLQQLTVKQESFVLSDEFHQQQEG